MQVTDDDVERYKARASELESSRAERTLPPCTCGWDRVVFIVWRDPFSGPYYIAECGMCNRLVTGESEEQVRAEWGSGNEKEAS